MPAFVSIIMGSKSDFSVMKHAALTLRKFGIESEILVASAHRTPEYTAKYVDEATEKGAIAFICGAGMAAHLAGAVAAKTVRPVIGVPLSASDLNGMDSLLSTVQMPSGIPVACVAIGKAGAINAAYLCVQMYAHTDSKLMDKLKADREEKAAAIKATTLNIDEE